MNKEQRNKNRETARIHEFNIAVCPECGEKGMHWISTKDTFFHIQPGFWTCKKFYGPDGKRLDIPS